jgi:hypothetical protein
MVFKGAQAAKYHCKGGNVRDYDSSTAGYVVYRPAHLHRILKAKIICKNFNFKLLKYIYQYIENNIM